jgi:hypothetical protein
MNMTQKIKVKSMSQSNHRKKVQKQNWNTIADETSLLDNIIKYSVPTKTSKSKLNTTMAVYKKPNNILPTTISNRETHNQSHNSRSSKKKNLNYMKQMMNKTVLIQNQDYSSVGPPNVSGVRQQIGPRIDLKKKSALLVPKQVVMVRLLFLLFRDLRKRPSNSSRN